MVILALKVRIQVIKQNAALLDYYSYIYTSLTLLRKIFCISPELYTFIVFTNVSVMF